MDLTHIAQTPLQLYNQLRLADYPEQELDEARSACEFLNSLFAGRYRATGKSLIEHCVGTASILETHGADAATVTAGLLHAVYSQGDFGGDTLVYVVRTFWTDRVLV
ncbi:MAG: HD domain-containing protein [Proteobacteria bacterium]|jgi:(p)ppGpp synthase/HD superfamily hydrolase|nr:HD domain-containing protein [Pseudomonadota bacterium]